jgi:hypothetical protein
MFRHDHHRLTSYQNLQYKKDAATRITTIVSPSSDKPPGYEGRTPAAADKNEPPEDDEELVGRLVDPEPVDRPLYAELAVEVPKGVVVAWLVTTVDCDPGSQPRLSLQVVPAGHVAIDISSATRSSSRVNMSNRKKRLTSITAANLSGGIVAISGAATRTNHIVGPARAGTRRWCRD